LFLFLFYGLPLQINMAFCVCKGCHSPAHTGCSRNVCCHAPVADTCNPSYSGGRGQEDLISKSPWQMVRETPILKNPSQKIGLVEWLKMKALSSSPSTKKRNVSWRWAWWHVPVISALGWWRQENWEVRASLGYIVRRYLKKKMSVERIDAFRWRAPLCPVWW
jgi:hypothetical protein